MVNGVIGCPFTAVLAGEIVPAEYFTTGEFEVRPGPVNHFGESDYGRYRQAAANRSNFTASVDNQSCFFGQ
jgi:hypothetical protein